MSEPKSTLLPTFGRVFGPLVNGSVVAPLTMVLIGVVVFGIWSSRRSAYALALALGAVSVVIYVFSGLSFLLAGSFASVFYGLTGLHGLHVFVGLTLLSIMNIRTLRGHFSPEAHVGVEMAGIYWHFVDVMWIIVFFTVYIL